MSLPNIDALVFTQLFTIFLVGFAVFWSVNKAIIIAKN